MMPFTACVVAVFLLCTACIQHVHGRLMEVDRIVEYNRRNHTWPPRDDEYRPNTEGWKLLHKRRFQQTARMVKQKQYNTTPTDWYSSYISSISSAIILPNFTELGWGLTTAPEHVWRPLHTAIKEALKRSDVRYEDYEPAIQTIQSNNRSSQEKISETRSMSTSDIDRRPLVASVGELRHMALEALHPLVEAWAGVPLEPTMAYGLRIYQNSSRLYMHLDQTATHVISAIFHIYHDNGDDDNDVEPWPLVIEGFDGKTYAAPLREGELLLYESAKCFHGRPVRFQGKHYSSLFLHYTPTDRVKDYPYEDDLAMSTHYRVPPYWNTGQMAELFEETRSKASSQAHDPYHFIDTFTKEPDCEHEWCAMKDAIWIDGPAPPYGQVLSGNGENEKIRHVFEEEQEKNGEL